MWPKGFFAEPTFAEKMEFFFRDNRDALYLATGFLVLVLYYLIAWSAVGRDPVRGVIMPLYEPPQNLSPAGMRYLLRMGFDNKTFAAAILDMAVRGYLTIKDQAGSYTLYLTGKPNISLSADESQLAAVLFQGRNEIWLHQENHQTIQFAMKALKKWLASTEQKTYFVTNSKYMIPPADSFRHHRDFLPGGPRHASGRGWRVPEYLAHGLDPCRGRYWSSPFSAPGAAYSTRTPRPLPKFLASARHCSSPHLHFHSCLAK